MNTDEVVATGRKEHYTINLTTLRVGKSNLQNEVRLSCTLNLVYLNRDR